MPQTAEETRHDAETAQAIVGRIVNPPIAAGEESGLAIRSTVPLKASYQYCCQLARSTGRNFYFSFLTLPRKRLRAMCALYAFMRVSDDIGDEVDASVEERERRLCEWRMMLEDAVGERSEIRGQRSEVSRNSTHQSPLTNHHSPIFPALADTITRHAVPAQYLHDVIDGVAADLRFRGFETFDELNRYCYQVAGAVGLCCVHIWGFHDERALPLAVDCGTAFQLTNILRDLGEDAAMGRCYLPREDLRRFDLTEADIAAQCRDDRFRELMRFQVNRAKEYYAKAGELFDHIERPGKPILAAMLKIYGGLLEEIERRDYDVFTERISLSRGRKLRIALGAVLRYRVFRR